MNLGEESIPSGEEEAIARVVKAGERLFDRSEVPIVRRDLHPKQHGCVSATFVVEADLPAEYRVGMFEKPGSYPAWVRFSSRGQHDDRKPDAHGMAIKVLDVEGPKLLDAQGREPGKSQDFVMVDNPTFFLRDATQYARFSEASLKAKGKARSFWYSILFFLPKRLRERLTLILEFVIWRHFSDLRKLRQFTGKRAASPLATQYWSTTAYLFGPGRAMKFRARPESENTNPPRGAWTDSLREAMITRLNQHNAEFEFQVQLQKNPEEQPVEDPTVLWNEEDCPFVTVARVLIPRQQFDSQERDAFGEHLSFTPWHALEAHRPLGGINRARRDVYLKLAALRHEVNDVPVQEPASADPGYELSKVRGPRRDAEVIRDELAAIRRRRTHVFDLKAPAPSKLLDGANADQRLTHARLESLEEHLVGLSFSGGGIRSGTFAVGFLQGLAPLGLLRRIDVLSTVSGGGYAGGWLAAWLKREGSVANVELQLNPSRVAQSHADRTLLAHDEVVDEEPEPIHHLRQNSSYLFPRPGFLTADTWSVIATWIRNVSINLLMLLPMAMILVLLARIVVYLYGYVNKASINDDRVPYWLKWLIFLVGIALLYLALAYNARALAEFRSGGRGDRTYRTSRPSSRPRFVASRIYSFILIPLVLATVCLSVPLRAIVWSLGGWVANVTGGERQTTNPLVNWFFDYTSAHLDLLGAPNIVGHALAVALLAVLGTLIVNGRNKTLVTQTFEGKRTIHWRYLGAAFMAGGTGGVLLTLLELLIRALDGAGRSDLAASVVPPLALLIGVAAMIVEVALLGREITEAEREWWARFSALLLIAALLWSAAMVSILYVPMAFLASGIPLRVAVTSGWLGATAFGVLTGRYGLKGKAGGRSTLAMVAALMPPIFLIGLLAAVSLLVAFLVNMPPVVIPTQGNEWAAVGHYLKGIRGTSFWTLVGWLILAGILYKMGGRLIDVNLFSLHAMYANRLIRCYLGASRARSQWADRWARNHDPAAGGGAPGLSEIATPALAPETMRSLWDELAQLGRRLSQLPRHRTREQNQLEWEQERRRVQVVESLVGQTPRNANPVTGFDLADDIPLFDLRIGAARNGQRRYWGPHLLVNTTLNLVAGQELAWRDRKGESFVLSPLFCGSKQVGYAEVTPATSENLTLGRAIAISGAAVDPNMSFYQSPALTAFLTIFNARLGYWMQNPFFRGWKAGSPRFADRLVAELYGRTDDRDEFVHLSDGGHFENLGIYELVRRRCRYIIAVDVGADIESSDDNLAQFIRLVRIDFGVRIEVDTEPLRAEGPDKLSRTHVVIGRIHYEDVDNGQMPGILVYVKVSMTGDEPSDVQRYAREDPRFPHQPTDLRQSFDEEQFESYRALGDHIARDVFGNAVSGLRDQKLWTNPSDHQQYIRGNQQLFSALRGRWAEPPPDQNAQYIDSSRDWMELQRDFRREPALANLTRDLYPELPAVPEENGAKVPEAERQRAELHAVGQMLQIMEDAWMKLSLKAQYDLPMNRGWMNVFRRWTSSDTFRRMWPTLRSEFSPDFVNFCESELRLAIAGPPEYERASAHVEADSPEAHAIQSLVQEFHREWPGEACPPRLSDGLQPPNRSLDAMIARARTLNLKPTSRASDGDQAPPIWLVLQAPAGDQTAVGSKSKFACGIVLVCDWLQYDKVDRDAAAQPFYPPEPGAFELLAWVRRAHRSTGLGSRCFEAILEEAVAWLKLTHPGQALSLRIRYPKSDRCAEGDLELNMWKSFFALYDFRPARRLNESNKKQTILELTIPA